MAQPKRASQAGNGKRAPRDRPSRSLEAVSRYDANIDHILKSAAAVFAEKSFGLASIRDIAAHARISFPRIYYYLRNKEELLYLISRRAFEELIGRAAQLDPATKPEERLRRFVENHLDYHISNLSEMKVLVREADTLSDQYAVEISRLKREYSRIARRFLEEISSQHGRGMDREHGRIITSLLFGAMNWFYTWYEPARDDQQRARIVDEVCRLFVARLSAS